MSKIEIAIIAYVFGLATMNDLNRHDVYNRLTKWLQNKSERCNDRKYK